MIRLNITPNLLRANYILREFSHMAGRTTTNNNKAKAHTLIPVISG